MSDTQDFQTRRGREGARWWNERPTGIEVASWFAESVVLHEGLAHRDFVSGIALITTTETTKTVVGYREDGAPRIAEIEEIAYTPYPRADARVLYFWRWMALHPEWHGAITPVTPPDLEGKSNGLPTGFFKLAVNKGEETIPFIGRAIQVEITLRGTNQHPVGVFPSEAKLVPLVDRFGAVDPDALAKASTGAIGRALGAAGVLVIPGSGVATAEDMLDLQRGAGAAQVVSDPAIPAALTPAPAELRESLDRLLAELSRSDQQAAMKSWWTQRGLPNPADLTDEQVKLALQKAQQLHMRATTFHDVPDGETHA